MIKTIILDIGNVLAHFRWKECLRSYHFDEDIITKIGEATIESDAWKEWDRGIQKEEDIIAECCRKNPEIAGKINEFFGYFKEWVKEYDYSEGFVSGLKNNGYKVYLLSNYSRTSFQYAKETFKFIKLVDGGVISYEVNQIKPEPEIYETLIKKYNINPKEAVFLDDVQANLDGAKRFGIQTILVREFDKALKELRELGVRI